MSDDWLHPPWHGDGVGAVMTTRVGGSSIAPWGGMNLGAHVGDDPRVVDANRAALAAAIDATPVYLEQVHGAHVVRLGPGDTAQAGSLSKADASLTTERGIACTVLVADCLPVLLAAPGARGVAAVHAGWRGLAGGVVEQALGALCEAAGCAPGELRAWSGACIGPRQFEVGADVLHAFGASPDRIDPYFRPASAGKWLADLAGLARRRLQSAGVRDISGGTWCSVEDPSRFFSFRRDGVTGRMAACIWIR
jgi:YfiH family protein